MDFEAEFFELSRNLGFDGVVSKQDLKQVCQGHARPVMQFLLTHLASEEKKRLIKLNLALRSAKTPAKTLKIESKSGILMEISNLESQLSALKRKFFTQKFANSIKFAYNFKLKKQIFALNSLNENLSFQLSPLLSQNPVSENELEIRVRSVIEQLDYLQAESKHGNLASGAACSIIENAELNSASGRIFGLLSKWLEGEKTLLAEKGKRMDISEEAKKHGFVYTKTGGKGRLQRENAKSLIENLRKQVETERNSQWKQFIEVEEVLAKATSLKSALRKVQIAKESTGKGLSGTLRSYLNLELELQSQCALRNSLEKGLIGLQDTAETLSNHLALLQSNSHKLSKSSEVKDLLLEKYRNLMDSNAGQRRNLPKMKLRIKEFLAKHFEASGSEVKSAVSQLTSQPNSEISKISSFWPAIIRISSGTSFENEKSLDVDLASSDYKREKIEDWKLRKILSVLDFPCYTPTSVLYAFFAPKPTVSLALDFEPLSKEILILHKEKVQTESPPLVISRLQDTKELLEEEKQHSTRLQTEKFPLWRDQNALFLVPWVRDKEGLSLSEWVEIWRQSVLRDDY